MSLNINNLSPKYHIYYNSTLNPNNESESTKKNTQKDSLVLSQLAQGLSQFPFDLSSSTASIKDDTINFNINYSDDTIFNMSATGFYSLRERKMESKFSFTYQKEVTEGDITKTKQFAVDITTSFSIKNEVSKQTNKSKETVMDFMKRIVDRVIEITKDDKKILTGIAFDDEDIKDIMSNDIGDGKIGKSLKELLYMILSFAMVKEMQNKDKDAEHILLTPKRKIEEVTKLEKNDSEDYEMNMNIKEITDDSEKEEDNVLDKIAEKILEKKEEKQD